MSYMPDMNGNDAPKLSTIIILTTLLIVILYLARG
jgi:hypothetical protein